MKPNPGVLCDVFPQKWALHKGGTRQSVPRLGVEQYTIFQFYIFWKNLIVRQKPKQKKKTRMHSSRMRTGRSLTVCRSLLPGGMSAPGGSALGEGGLLPGRSVCSGGCLLLGGLLPGGSAPGGIPACNEADPPCEQNDRQV